ncbi:MAG: bifunctional folylpolyglutamate synthase/dihydrofolate synthase [Ostreibacterium sp.]
MCKITDDNAVICNKKEGNKVKYNADIETLEDFYKTIYAIPPRLTRLQYTPKAVTQNLLAALGHPQQSLNSVLITGSKGKGSSAIMLASLLKEAGKTVGLFSSPHLFDFRERIVINGEMINQRHLLQSARRVFNMANQLVINHPDEFPRFFEVTTAIAYLYFFEQGVDYAVIETGIGAMTDATNQDSHCLSVLTNIESEHLDIFGSINDLAIEKSGVMLPKIPLILGDLSEEIDQIIIQHAMQLGVPVTRFKRNFIQNNSGFYRVKVGHDLWIADSISKAKNAWIALEAFKKLEIDLTDDEKVSVLDNIHLPAREEIVSKIPFVIIDGAHTAESAMSLSHYVEKSLKTPPRKIVLLVSFSAKKNIERVMSAFPTVDKIVVTQATASRSISSEKIKKQLKKLSFFENSPKIKVIDNPLVALEKTMKKLQKEDVLIITGSVYLAGLVSQQFRLYP